MSTAELVRHAAKSRGAAQQRLFDLLAGRMFLLCLRYLKDREKAEEIMQDGFVRMFQALPRFDYIGEPAFLPWVKKIMINECLMELRRKTAFIILAEDAGAEQPVEAEVLEKMSSEEILGLIARLPAGYRTIFNLAMIEGFSHREIAAMLDISEGTSKSQLSRARILLQKMLDQNGHGYAQRKSR